MKKIIIALLLLTSCEKTAQEIKRTSNNEFQAELLFEHDGIKVYRFHDAGKPVYFINATGSTQYETRKIIHYGKNMVKVNEKHQVHTVGEKNG